MSFLIPEPKSQLFFLLLKKDTALSAPIVIFIALHATKRCNSTTIAIYLVQFETNLDAIK